METKFNVKQKVWIMFNNKPIESKVNKIIIDDIGIHYLFSEPFIEGKEADSGMIKNFERSESVIASTKDALLQKIFNPKPI